LLKQLVVSMGSLLLVGLAGGCVGAKEAEDPKDILGEELEKDGVYGGGTAPDSPRDHSADPGSPARPATAANDVPATRAECETAARHLVELGIDLAIAEEPDAAKKKKLAAEKSTAMTSERARAHIAEWTKECVERRTTRGEAHCIARIKQERDIDACVGGS
jgi:hypothetical protein